MTKVPVPIMHCLQWFNTNSQLINCEMIPYWFMFNNHAISTHIHVPDRSCDKPSFQIKMYTKNEKVINIWRKDLNYELVASLISI